MIQWTNLWKLYFNDSKCKCLHIGKTNPKHKYTIDSDGKETELTKCTEEKDLGITIDEELSFDVHIKDITTKANQLLGVIKRTFTFTDKDVLIRLYKGLIRPRLEYGNVIWSPHLKRQSIAIEAIQRRATKLIGGMENLSYKERLQKLNLPSLKARRIRGDLIQCYKIFRGFDNLKIEDFFQLVEGSRTRNSVEKIFITHRNKDIRKYTFSMRVAPYWNALPTNTKKAQNTNTFKNMLDRWRTYTKLMYDFDE